MIFTQFIKFCVNGGVLGIAAIFLQSTIFSIINSNSEIAYAIASVITYIPLIVVNFLIQKKFIFQKQGLFLRFVVANLIIMFLVSLFSLILRSFLGGLFGLIWGNRLGFIFAALFGAIPSFFLKKIWVFKA